MESTITFIKTRYVYDSYSDFWQLVELSGFPVIFVDQLDTSQPGVFITSPMNGEWRPHIDNQASKPRNAFLILWNIERPSGSAGSVGQYAEANHELIEERYVDEVWVSDRRLAEETWLRFVVLGSHPDLGESGKHKKYNLCHMSYLVPRRENILKHFPESTIGPNCWGAARDQVLMESKFALNIHQDGHPFQEPLRFALFAAYGLPIVTETIYDSYPWSDEFMVYASYPSLARRMNEVLSSDYEEYRLMGLRARERMCNEFNFGKMVREAVTQSIGSSWR